MQKIRALALATLALATACSSPHSIRDDSGFLGQGGRMEGQSDDGPRWRLALVGRQLRVQWGDGGAVFDLAAVPQPGVRWRGVAPRMVFTLPGSKTLSWEEDRIRLDGQRHRLTTHGTTLFHADGSLSRSSTPWSEWPATKR